MALLIGLVKLPQQQPTMMRKSYSPKPAHGNLKKENMMPKRIRPPERLVRFCGADCSGCESYRRFMTGSEDWLVNIQTGFRCCWLPKGYPKGKDCEIRICCEEKGIEYCGECPQFEACQRMKEFYSKSGYDALKNRMQKILKERTTR